MSKRALMGDRDTHTMLNPAHSRRPSQSSAHSSRSGGGTLTAHDLQFAKASPKPYVSFYVMKHMLRWWLGCVCVCVCVCAGVCFVCVC